MSSAQTFHRPPREYPEPVPSETMRVAAPPTEPVPPSSSLIQTLFPVIGGVGIFGFALVYGNTAFLYIGAGMMILLLGFSFAMRWSQKRSVRKRAAADARRYAKYLRERDHELAEAGELQRAALRRLYPDPAALWADVVKRRGVWERRPDHDDFLQLRLGTGKVKLDRPVEFDVSGNPLTEYQPVPLREAQGVVGRRSLLMHQPVVSDVGEIGVLAVTGDPERSRAWARALMVQLAAFRSPHDVVLTAAVPAEAADAWTWAKWLPHAWVEAAVRDASAPVRAIALARDAAELEALLEPTIGARLEALRRMAEVDVRGPEMGIEAPELVLFIDGYAPGHPANNVAPFRELLAHARELRALVVLLCRDRESEPTDIDARLSIPARGAARFERSGRDGEAIDELTPDAVDIGTAEAIARSLTPLRLAEGGGGGRSLADTVRLVELLGLESVDDLDPARLQARRPRRETLRVPFGIGADGEVIELDLKQAAEEGMGPHGVLVGATGSGKSELLRSIVAGLAATHDPETLSFVLVDYKGGAAFAELSRLPHVAGLITNLQEDLTLVDRMRDALVGEQQRRQSMLRDAGNLDDAVAYRARRDADPSLPPLPDLFVIVDEFAELLQARPEFIDLFVALGRVGRSLGIHLLLASQRLDEGRLRGLESHLRYRICLRTYSAVESKMVIGTPDAYLLQSLPGLGYLKVDTTVYRQFRAALVSTPHLEAEVAMPTESPAALRPFDAGSPLGGASAPVPAGGDDDQDRVTEAHVLVDRLVAGSGEADFVHQVWVAPLPEELALDTVEDGVPFWEAEATRPLHLSVGRVDRPLEQRTDPLVLDLEGGRGHVAFVGAPRTGKSTALRTLLAALVRRHTPREARVYAIDLGGGLLGAGAAAPQVGGVVGKLDPEAVRRIVAQLQAELSEREERFRRLRLESMEEARARRGELDGEDLADIVLMVDGWDTFKREFEGLDRELEELAAAGLNFGVHLVISANRWAEIRPALLDNLGTRIELRLNDPIDSIVSRAASAALGDAPPGRGLTADGLHVQLALPRADGIADDGGLGAAFAELAEEAARHWTAARAEPIRLLPREVAISELPPPGADGVAVGIDERRLEPVFLDLLGGDPHLLVYGDAGSGKTSLVRCLALGLARTHEPDELRLYVADTRRALGDLASLAHVAGIAATGPALQDLLAPLASELAAHSSASLPPGTSPPVRHVLLVDDYDLISGPAGSPLAALADLLALGRDLGLHVVLTRRVGGSARAQFEPVQARVRELGSPVLLLSGDGAEGPIAGGVKAMPLPPGRGLLVRRGERPSTVQLALTEPHMAGIDLDQGAS